MIDSEAEESDDDGSDDGPLMQETYARQRDQETRMAERAHQSQGGRSRQSSVAAFTDDEDDDDAPRPEAAARGAGAGAPAAAADTAPRPGCSA